MTEKMKRVKDMIRKTFTTEEERNCFDGCVLYIEQYCDGIRVACLNSINEKFVAIERKLDKIISIVGVNGDGQSQ